MPCGFSKRRCRPVCGPDGLATVTSSWNRSCAVAVLFTIAFLIYDQTCGADPTVRVHFTSGEVATGTLLDSGDPQLMNLQSTVFVMPLQFPVRQIQQIQFPDASSDVDFDADYRFELENEDVLLGSIVEIKGTHAVLDVKDLGRLQFDISAIRRMQPWKAPAGLVFHGPGRLNDWNSENGWSADGRHLQCDHAPKANSAEDDEARVIRPEKTTIRRDLNLPTRGRIEFIISWKDSADFEFRVGAGDGYPQASFEIWNDVNRVAPADVPSSALFGPQISTDTGSLVLMRDVEWTRVQSSRDSLFLKSITSGPGRVHLQMYFDQESEFTQIYSSSGRLIGSLNVRSMKPVTRRHVELTARSRHVRLERIDVGNWSGEIPNTENENECRLLMTDGTLVYGRLIGFEGDRREFVLANADGEKRIVESSVQDITVSRQSKSKQGLLQAETRNGNRISGSLVRIDATSIRLKSDMVPEELVLPLTSLRSLSASGNRPSLADQQRRLGYPRGRLETAGHVLLGTFLDSESNEEKRLTWKPDLCQGAGLISHSINGRLVFRDRMPVTGGEVPSAGLPIPAITRNEATTRQTKSLERLRRPVVHLASGDQIPCFQLTLNEEDAFIASSNTETTRVKLDEIRGIDLVRGIPATPTGLKVDRFLVLPRSQRNDPPTHLIQSNDGDLLRGRVVGMDLEAIMVALRQDVQRVPRDSVARIISLSAKEAGLSVAPDPNEGMPAHVILAGGSRLSFAAAKVAGIFLSGRSPILGECRADLQHVDEIRFGDTVTEIKAIPWAFRQAADPLGTDEGKTDRLIGAAAPDFDLVRLDGGRVKLSAYAGKIVILDFWASWCAPCMQLMPQVDKVAKEFADQGVVLITVNLGERPEQIRTVMDRLKLSTTVLLEPDGQVAARYGATNIPLTVVVGRDGKIARVFVGSGTRFSDTLRDALTDVTGKRQSTERPMK